MAALAVWSLKRASPLQPPGGGGLGVLIYRPEGGGVLLQAWAQHPSICFAPLCPHLLGFEDEGD